MRFSAAQFLKIFPHSGVFRSTHVAVSPDDTQLKVTDQSPELHRFVKLAIQTEQTLAPFFLPFMVELARENHPYNFFPRRWFESASLLGVIRGFSNTVCRENGVKGVSDEKQAFIVASSRLFQWPASSITNYLNEVSFHADPDFRNGMILAKNVLSERGRRKNVYELSLIQLIDDEYYKVAADLKKRLTNPVEKAIFQPRDFQIAKGW